jgi:hypothetical protein
MEYEEASEIIERYIEAEKADNKEHSEEMRHVFACGAVKTLLKVILSAGEDRERKTIENVLSHINEKIKDYEKNR